MPAEDVLVGYRAREKLVFDVRDGGTVSAPNEAVGRTTAVEGIPLIEEQTLTQASVVADLRELNSDIEMRDGELIAFQMVAADERSEDIYTNRIDGTHLQHRTCDVGYEYAPAWLDDTSLVLVREGQLIELDLATSEEITINASGQVNLPAPAPDGTRAVVASGDNLAIIDLATASLLTLNLAFNSRPSPLGLSHRRRHHRPLHSKP